ncbi:MAG TPA: uroporphyrinogen-III C-methyltransferase [Dyella sp.]|nr:uroporphyrinogen-III C-methyltransferase [Dyella sp.]
MNNDDAPNETAKVAPAPARPAASRPAEPKGSGGALAVALLLALLSIAGVAYVGWQQWQQTRGDAAAAGTLAQLDTRVASLETSLKALDDDRRSLSARLRDADDVNRGLREEVLGQNERLRNLEDAVAKLSEKSLSSHDAMLLDETESLLRMGKARYELFHDAAGAATAYGLADQALSGVDDAAFRGLRQSVTAEHEALERAVASRDGAALAKLQQLRGTIGGLPLRPLDAPAASSSAGTWARIGQALSSVVRIGRDNGAPMAVADARLARELVALDLAQAEAALLAHDEAAFRDALQRADASLSSQFDGTDAAVKTARGTLAGLIRDAAPGTPVQLGEALTELRNLRAVHALKPSAAVAAPAKSGARP